MFNGHGIYYHSDGVKYEGYWVDDEKVYINLNKK